MAAELSDLQRLKDWCGSGRRVAGGLFHRSASITVAIERLVIRLGQVAVPLLGRELASPDPQRRDAARGALAIAAVTSRDRVLAELRMIAANASTDDIKITALGLLAELGERGIARFVNPPAIQRRSALALAQQLESRSDVASAADLVVRQIRETDIFELLAAMREVAPDAATWLGDELVLRLDLDRAIRARIAELVEAEPAEPATDPAPARSVPSSPRTRRPPRPTHVSVLVDAAARLVVVASRKVSGERRWRRWAVLISQAGRIDDCLYQDENIDDVGPLITNLCADGYRVASTDADRARTLVAAAARRTAAGSNTALGSPYYLGRDLLDLFDAHAVVPGKTHTMPTRLGRAVDLVAAGEYAQAETLLARCEQSDSEVAAAQAACLLARGDHAGAIEPLQRAVTADPGWPLHHWNLGVALHKLGDVHGCYQALRRFVATSAAPTGLYADPDQPGRVACAERLLNELERTARLTGTSLRSLRRRRRAATAKPRRARR